MRASKPPNRRCAGQLHDDHILLHCGVFCACVSTEFQDACHAERQQRTCRHNPATGTARCRYQQLGAHPAGVPRPLSALTYSCYQQHCNVFCHICCVVVQVPCVLT
jgi:hypothetical protein